MIPRVIPCLLLSNHGLVKTVQFGKPTYLGDPVNIVRIFNDKEVDELIILDIDATRQRRPPDFRYLEQIATECFMPLCYGGGIRTLEDMRRLFELGVEKVCVNTLAVDRLSTVGEAAEMFGSQSVVVSIDVKKGLLGKYRVVAEGGRRGTDVDPVSHAKTIAAAGAGEIIVNAVDRDGTMKGYDLQMLAPIAEKVPVPVIASGGAGSLADFKSALDHAHVSAVAAGSFFVFKGKHRAVLISYPSRAALKETLGEIDRWSGLREMHP